MICPLLEEVWIIDQVTERMERFFSEYHDPFIYNLIDNMRSFFSETWWIPNNTYNYYYQSGYRDGSKTAMQFIVFAEASMDNYRTVADKAIEKEWAKGNNLWRRS